MRIILENSVKALKLEGRIDLDACLFYLKEMRAWDKTHGLTAIKDPHEMVIKHLADSLSIHPFIQGNRWVDVGSGAGLPGIPLALLFPEKQFTLVESQNKKAGFLRHIKRILHLDNVEVIQQRVEMWHPEHRFDGVVTRAFSSLLQILQLTKHLCSDEGCFLAMKGGFPEEELQLIENECQRNSLTVRVEPVFVPGLNAERHCVLISPIRENEVIVSPVLTKERRDSEEGSVEGRMPVSEVKTGETITLCSLLREKR